MVKSAITEIESNEREHAKIIKASISVKEGVFNGK
jgi:hypothetical protein